MHFTHLSNYNKPDNRLHRAALDLLRSKSNLLVPDAKAFLSDLRDRIKVLNREHPQCTPLHPSDSREYSQGDSIQVWLGGYTVSFQLHPVREQQSEIRPVGSVSHNQEAPKCAA